jgi:hypothetical protein
MSGEYLIPNPGTPEQLGIYGYCDGEPPYPPEQAPEWQTRWERGWWAACEGRVPKSYMREIKPRMIIPTKRRAGYAQI